MFKYTANTLKRLETLLQEAGYVVRYEKGNFNAGYCILENKKVIVINKYFETEARINSLIEILGRIPVQENTLSEASQEFFSELQHQTVRT